MADKTPGGPQAVDLFAMGTAFRAQESNEDVNSQVARAFTSDGDEGCVSLYDTRTDKVVDYRYCGTGIVAGFGSVLTSFGNQKNSIQVTAITVTFSVGDQPRVQMVGHNHTQNDHSGNIGQANMSSVIPSGIGGLTVPNIWTNNNGDSSPIEVTVNFLLDHIDQMGADGFHFAGANIHLRVEVNARYTGIPSLSTDGWTVRSTTTTKSNENFHNYVIQAEKYFAKT